MKAKIWKSKKKSYWIPNIVVGNIKSILTLQNQRYFELGPEKLELSYFPPSYAIFPPSYAIFPPSCAIFFFFPPVTLENSVTGGKQKKIA